MIVYAPISVGELLDKITILTIKENRATVASARSHITAEKNVLWKVWDKLHVTEQIDLYETLYQINMAIWDAEIEIRRPNVPYNAKGRLGERIAKLNDERAALKRRLSALYNSDIIEEKVYA